MTKPANYALMASIHRKLAEYMRDILDEAKQEVDPDDPDSMPGMPLDAATMGTISKFLKDNEITSDPAEKDNLDELRNKFSRGSQSKIIKSVNNIIEEAKADDLPFH